MKIYIHIDSKSTYIGNGGLITLTNLATKLIEMGYETYIFDQNNTLTQEKIRWIDLDNLPPITKTNQIRLDGSSRIITCWLRTLPDKLRKPRNLRFLESSELLRKGHEAEREWLIKNKVKIANLHSHLKSLYKLLGVTDMIDLDVWIREDVKQYGNITRLENSVGIQLEKKTFLKFFKVYDWSRYGLFRNENLIVCNGTYGQVINRMNMADFFIHNPRPSPHIPYFRGETFGLPLFEAMACGCVCIARKHEGIKFLDGTIPLVKDMQEAKEILTQLKNDKKEKEEIRIRSLTFIEKNYRFNDKRRNAILRWLE